MTGLVLTFAMLACGGSSTLGPDEDGGSQNVHEVQVEPDSADVAVGDTVQFEARVTDGSGSEVSGYSFSWSVSDPSLATVDGGRVVGMDEGTVRLSVHATSSTDGVNASTASESSVLPDTVGVNIGLGSPAAVEVTPDSVALSEGDTARLDATVRDASGERLARSVSWSSSNTSVATVDRQGEVQGILGGEAVITARSGDASGSATVVVAGSSEQPNEPEGYERFAEWNASERPGTFSEPCQSESLLAGCGIGGTGENLSYPEDSSAPKSPGGVWRVTYPEGMTPGTGPGLINQLWENGSESLGNEHDEIYYSTWFKFHGPNGSSDFEVPAPGMKLFGYFGAGEDGSDGAWQNYWIIENNSDTQTQIQSSFKISFKQQDVISSTRDQNVETGEVLRAGQWQHMEFVARINDIGSANGEFHMWINGVKIHEHHDVRYRTSEAPQAFNGARWAPVWGGTGGTAKTRNDYLIVDHVYISGVPTQ